MSPSKGGSTMAVHFKECHNPEPAQGHVGLTSTPDRKKGAGNSMKSLTAAVLVAATLLTGESLFAQQAQQFIYARGTMQAVKEGATGTVDKSSPSALRFQSAQESFSIPYASITSFQFHRESRYHLGVLPAIAVGLFMPWARRHLVTITWNGENHVPEVVTLEASKSATDGLLEVMRARASEACKPGPRGVVSQACGAQSFE
jgi:hypothetical protein